MAFTLSDPVLSADAKFRVSLACDPAVEAATRGSRAAQLAMLAYPSTGVWPEGLDVPGAATFVLRPLDADERDQAVQRAGVAPPLGAKIYQRYIERAGEAGIDAADIASKVAQLGSDRATRRRVQKELKARRIDPDSWTAAEHRAAALEAFIGDLEMHERHALTSYQVYAARHRAIVLAFGWVEVEQGGETYQPDEFIARLDAAGFARLSDRVRQEVAQHIERLTYARPTEKKA